MKSHIAMRLFRKELMADSLKVYLRTWAYLLSPAIGDLYLFQRKRSYGFTMYDYLALVLVCNFISPVLLGQTTLEGI